MTTQTQTQTQTQTLATGNAADPINFENYALLYDKLTTTQADLDEETCRLPIWCIFPDDRELKSHWADVISADHWRSSWTPPTRFTPCRQAR